MKPLLIGILTVCLLGAAAHAGEATDRTKACNAAAGLVKSVAKARDRGVSSDHARAAVARVSAQNNTPAPVRAIIDAEVTLVYGDRKVTPDMAAGAVLKDCLNSADKSSQ